MTLVTTVAATLALLGAALVGGVFFAFSSFVMQALARVPASEGINTMQSINIVVINPSFLGAFLGTTALSVLVVALSLNAWADPEAPWYLAGALLYLVGTFLVTGLGNVPLNDQLAIVSAADPDAVTLWEHYLDRWTRLNTVRTVAATLATLAFAMGLMRSNAW